MRGRSGAEPGTSTGAWPPRCGTALDMNEGNFDRAFNVPT